MVGNTWKKSLCWYFLYTEPVVLHRNGKQASLTTSRRRQPVQIHSFSNWLTETERSLKLKTQDRKQSGWTCVHFGKWWSDDISIFKCDYFRLAVSVEGLASCQETQSTEDLLWIQPEKINQLMKLQPVTRSIIGFHYFLAKMPKCTMAKICCFCLSDEKIPRCCNQSLTSVKVLVAKLPSSIDVEVWVMQTNSREL